MMNKVMSNEWKAMGTKDVTHCSLLSTCFLERPYAA